MCEWDANLDLKSSESSNKLFRGETRMSLTWQVFLDQFQFVRDVVSRTL